MSLPAGFKTDGIKRQPGFQNRKWHPAAVCIASGMSSKMTAELVGVSITAISRWRQSPKFKAYVDRVHDEAIEQAIGILANAMEKAAKVVMDLLDSADPELRLKASDRVKEWVKHFRNDALVLRKLEQLEAKLPTVVIPTGV